MKKLLIGLLVLGNFSAIAGTLENRSNGDTLDFNFDSESEQIRVTSTSLDTESMAFNEENLNKRTSNIRFYTTTDYICNDIYGDDEKNEKHILLNCLLVPIANIPGLTGIIADTIFLPFVASVKLIETMNYNRDFKILKKVINFNIVKKVSNKRFKRIERLLRYKRQ